MQKKGTISRIIFHNDSNGYTVAVFTTEDGSFRIAGAFNEPKIGSAYRVEGSFTVHPKYGEQFSVKSYEEMMPEGEEAITAFLASGAIAGIGPKTAERIVKLFGENTLKVMEETPERLLEVRGIGKKNYATIVESFAESRDFAEISLKLQDMGLEMPECVRIFKMYGTESVNIIRENPYVLVDDIRGINFTRADRIASLIGINEASEFRLRCAIKHVLKTWAVNGSTLMPESLLIEKTSEVTNIGEETIREWLLDMAFCGELQTDTVEEVPVIYLYDYYHAEQRTAHNLRRIKEDKYISLAADVDNLITDALKQLTLEGRAVVLSDKQREAVREAVLNNVTVITGGPGTGKTTIINVIVKIFERLDYEFALAAPTGRAAKRMEEATGATAMTIHRLLEFVFSEDEALLTFGRNEENPLKQMVIIVDEASMIDIMLMDALLAAIQSGARLIITGDADQLPSVGAGNVLRDIIHSDYVKVVRLKEIFRQAEDSMIVTNAHLINEGEYPETGEGRKDRDFFFIRKNSEEDILEDIKSMIGGRLENYYDFIHGPQDIQVLTPTKKGLLGAPNLNTVLQEVVNPPADHKTELKVKSRLFREGDKVMQLRNNYMAEWRDEDSFEEGEGVFNGDMGVIVDINPERKSMSVSMDGKRIEYEGEMLEDLDLAYAITVHKSQGSE
ncbi:MAG: ATP-dependent RecD-like DNA helicase, partial [Mogibacterium sp.]|nr:ATP-dependent RecD-like DNA helicase [Mogibacterium sp.]